MPSNRLALLAVCAGAGLLGFSAAGVTAVAGNAPATASPASAPHHHDHHHHRGERGL